MTARGRREKGGHPSVVSGNISTPEDATPCFSENEPAHNCSRNLNNGSATTNPQTKHTQTARKPQRRSPPYHFSVSSFLPTHKLNTHRLRVNQNGVLQGTVARYDPFGQPIDPVTGDIGTEQANDSGP